MARKNIFYIVLFLCIETVLFGLLFWGKQQEYFLILKKELPLERLTLEGLENYVGSTLVNGYLQERVDFVVESADHGHADIWPQAALRGSMRRSVRRFPPGWKRASLLPRSFCSTAGII